MHKKTTTMINNKNERERIRYKIYMVFYVQNESDLIAKNKRIKRSAKLFVLKMIE